MTFANNANGGGKGNKKAGHVAAHSCAKSCNTPHLSHWQLILDGRPFVTVCRLSAIIPFASFRSHLVIFITFLLRLSRSYLTDCYCFFCCCCCWSYLCYILHECAVSVNVIVPESERERERCVCTFAYLSLQKERASEGNGNETIDHLTTAQRGFSPSLRGIGGGGG